MNLNNQVIDQVFFTVPLLRFAELAEEKPPAEAMRQMIEELNQFINRKGNITRKDMTLENWKSSLEIPRSNGGDRPSASV